MSLTSLQRNILIIILLASILLLATYLRLYNIEEQTLWYDEILSAGLAEKSIDFIFKTSQSCWHYLFIKLALLFSYSTLAIKIPGIIAGIGSILVMFFIGRRLKNNVVGLVASFLTAVSPVLIFFSGEVRYYSYLVFFSALALLLFLYWHKKNSIWAGMGLTLALIAPLFVHMLGGFILIAFWAYFIILAIVKLTTKKSNLKSEKLPRSSLIAFLASLSFAIVGFIGAVILLPGGSWKYNIGNLVGLTDNFGNVSYGTTFLEVNKNSLPYSNFVWDFFRFLSSPEQVGAILMILLFIVGLVFFWKRNRDFFILTLSAITLMLAIPLLVSHSHWWDHKYFLTFIPFYLAIVATGVLYLAELILRFLRVYKVKFSRIVLVIIIIILCLSFGAGRQLRLRLGEYHVNKYNWEVTANYLIQNTKPGDMIILSDNHMSHISFIYYFNNGPEMLYKPGTLDVEEAGNSSYKKLFNRFTPKHLQNNNDVQIETLQTLSVHPREKLAQIQEVFDRGNNIWFVSIAGYQYYSIKFTTEQIEKVSPGGIEILKLKPVEITDPFWTEVDKKNYKINYQIPSQLQEIYYLNGLEWGEQGLFLSEKLQAGTVTHVLKFMETDKQGRRIEILPAELVISGNLLGDELTKATLEVSANGKDFTTVTELSSGSFQEKIALKDISPVWLSHLIWLRLTVDSTNQAIIENLEVQSKDKLPLTWGAVDIANFSANPLPIIDDNLSTNSVALRNESTAGPYINLEPGQYEATFHLRVLQVTPNDPSMLDVVIGGGSRTLAETIINETTSNNYKEFRLDFEIDEPTQIEARLKYNQYDDIWFDYLIIKPR